MKKLAILIGNNNGLPGVKKDLYNMHEYLVSNKGGSWVKEEIKPKLFLEYVI